jgi:hypothetical protein
MEIAIFLPEHEKGCSGSKLALLIHRCVENAEIWLFPVDDPVLYPLPTGLELAFVLAENLDVLLTLETVRARAPELPIVLVNCNPRYTIGGDCRQVCGYLTWPPDENDIQTSLANALAQGNRSNKQKS